MVGDEEKIIAASIEARFFEESWPVPGVLDAGGTKPFELYGYPDRLIWKLPDVDCPLDRLFGGGSTAISFQAPGEIDCCEDGRPFIEFGPDRATARTVIRRYTNGLDGDGMEVTLKKIGNEWFVVDLQLRFVS